VKLLATLGVTALVLVAGCSKDSAPTQAQYAAAADGVCKVAHDDLAAQTKEHRKKNPDGGANQRFVRATFIPRLKGMTGELRGIPAPETDGAYLADVYSSYDHALDLLYSDPLGDTSDRAGEAAESRMKSYGMAECAKAAHIAVADVSG
jgi:hypothetical protein